MGSEMCIRDRETDPRFDSAWQIIGDMENHAKVVNCDAGNPRPGSKVAVAADATWQDEVSSPVRDGGSASRAANHKSSNDFICPESSRSQ